MTIRQWLTSAALSAGLGLGAVVPAYAADKKVEFTFGSLQAVSVEAAKGQAEAWLKKASPSYDAAALAKIWADDEASVLDRTLATLEMGSADAKKILADARNADREAPKAVPALLKDDKQDKFLRANLTLGFARNLTNARVYEESLEALSAVKPEDTVEPGTALFHRAVAEHALIKKDDAMRSIIRLLDDVSDAPDRYKMLATIMFIDMGNWKRDEKDLANIKRLMDNSERRLTQARGGKVTQDIQKKIVFRLDELIKEKEQQAKGGGQCNGGSCPNGGEGNTPGKGSIRSNNNAPDSTIMGGSGEGKVDDKKLKEIQEKWGTMPEKDRARAIVEITKDLPARYRVVIEEYFKSLSSATAGK